MLPCFLFKPSIFLLIKLKYYFHGEIFSEHLIRFVSSFLCTIFLTYLNFWTHIKLSLFFSLSLVLFPFTHFSYSNVILKILFIQQIFIVPLLYVKSCVGTKNNIVSKRGIFLIFFFDDNMYCLHRE